MNERVGEGANRMSPEEESEIRRIVREELMEDARRMVEEVVAHLNHAGGPKISRRAVG